jgi:hypothetical protein
LDLDNFHQCIERDQAFSIVGFTNCARFNPESLTIYEESAITKMAKQFSSIQNLFFAMILVFGSIAVPAVVFDFGGTVSFNLGPDGVKLELEGTPSLTD